MLMSSIEQVKKLKIGTKADKIVRRFEFEPKREQSTNLLPRDFFDDSIKGTKQMDYNDRMKSMINEFNSNVEKDIEQADEIREVEFNTRAEDQIISETDRLIKKWSTIQQIHDIKDGLVIEPSNNVDQIHDQSNASEDDDIVSDSDLDDLFYWRQCT
ncbi:hypothetical protein ACOME3_009275 [Neoechinorhynchus agilis]